MATGFVRSACMYEKKALLYTSVHSNALEYFRYSPLPVLSAQIYVYILICLKSFVNLYFSSPDTIGYISVNKVSPIFRFSTQHPCGSSRCFKISGFSSASNETFPIIIKYLFPYAESILNIGCLTRSADSTFQSLCSM